VLIEMVIDSAYPRFSFAICNLQKEPLVILSTDSTKSLSEWILRIRKAKFLRTGMTYGVAAAAPEEKPAPRDPKTQAAKDAFAAYVSNGAVPSGASLSTIDLNPLKWKPVPDGPDCVVYVEGTLREGTVQKLVEIVLDDQLSSTHFVYTFMATFRYFLKPVEFFPYVLRAWTAVKPAAETQTAQIRVLLVLKLWLMYNFCDFCETPELAKWVLVFFHQHLNSGPHAAVFQKYAAVLVEVMKESALPAPASNAGPNALLPAVFSKEHIEMIDLHPMEIARQLTLYSFGLFAAITPNELMFQRWNSQDKETLCPNVMRMIRRSNTVTMWVQTLILTVETPEARVAMLQRMLEVAWFLLELNNLGSVVEVYSGLQGSAVRRLTDTWEQLSEQATTIWKRLQELCDSSSNFKRYRARLAEAEGPSLPHLGRCLTDLTFSEDGLKTFLEGGRVNVSKCVVIGGVVSDILKRQRIRYALKPVEAFQSYFQRLEPLSEEALYAKSLLCQPREAK
jgi:son of sevenless-like protein